MSPHRAGGSPPRPTSTRTRRTGGSPPRPPGCEPATPSASSQRQRLPSSALSLPWPTAPRSRAAAAMEQQVPRMPPGQPAATAVPPGTCRPRPRPLAPTRAAAQAGLVPRLPRHRNPAPRALWPRRAGPVVRRAAGGRTAPCWCFAWLAGGWAATPTSVFRLVSYTIIPPYCAHCF